MANDQETKELLFEYLLCLADDRLVLGHRISEWCGHAPELEEDIALANFSLDYIGQASALYKYAAEVEDKGRTEDDLAFLRDPLDFKNFQLLEQPNGDFAVTIARQFFFDTYEHFLTAKLKESPDKTLAGIAEKIYKEGLYHFRHSSEWVKRLGDGTPESHKRMAAAIDRLWTYTKELYSPIELETKLIAKGIIPDLSAIESEWRAKVTEVLKEATLEVPSDERYMSEGSRAGIHTEHLGHMLAEMQSLPRTHPDATW